MTTTELAEFERGLQARKNATDVVLADHDPISRYVLSSVLTQADSIDLVACVDSRQPVAGWPVHCATVVVLCLGPDDDFRDALATLVATGGQVVVVSTFWDRRRLDQAFTLGAKGCLIKDHLPDKLICAVRAVNASHCVISPDLLDWYLPASGRNVSRDCADRDAERRLATLTVREREVLELLARGASTDEIAAHLTVSPSTVKSHISRALTKLDARNRLEAVLLIRDV